MSMEKDDSSTLRPLTAEWPQMPGLGHGFLGRIGGVSHGPFASLNLSTRVGDHEDDVLANWNRVDAELGGGGDFVRIHQVHGDVVVEASDALASEPEADAVMTRDEGLVLTILTADCVPLLFADVRTGAIAAVHAGWRGTLAGIAPRVVHELHRAFGTQAADLHVALGPSIGSCCYEVSEEIADAMEERWGNMPFAVHRRDEARPRLDLRAVNSHLLRQQGVHGITCIGPCTRCANTSYFSHRQATQEANSVTGRQLSYITRRSSAAPTHRSAR